MSPTNPISRDSLRRCVSAPTGTTSEAPQPFALADAPLGQAFVVVEVGGERGFRRRLMELGLVPGTEVTVKKVAPLGDPLELVTRGCSLSIRTSEARAVRIIARV